MISTYTRRALLSFVIHKKNDGVIQVNPRSRKRHKILKNREMQTSLLSANFLSIVPLSTIFGDKVKFQ